MAVVKKRNKKYKTCRYTNKETGCDYYFTIKNKDSNLKKLRKYDNRLRKHCIFTLLSKKT